MDSVIIGVVLAAALTALGWLLRQPIKSIDDKLSMWIEQTNTRLNRLEDWRVSHLENSHKGQ